MPDSHKPAFSATKILLPTDFSSASEAAFEAATGLALQFHAAIHLVHIIPEIPDWNGSDFFPETEKLTERKETIKQKLSARKDQLEAQGLTASFSIETGNDIVGNLMRVIGRESADMVVISTHGMSGWHPLLFGSIAEQVSKQVNCTLLLLQSVPHTSEVAEPAIDVWEDSFVPPVAEAAEAGSTDRPQEAAAEKDLSRIAGDLAEQGGKTEQKYDQAHSIFTK